MVWLKDTSLQHGIYFLSPPNTNAFEEAYLSVRAKEGRVYPDQIVKQLPYLPPVHVQQPEWKLRVWSMEQFFRQTNLSTDYQILDLGCGNGWFTHQLAERSGAQVLGLDVNQLELQQAARLFNAPNCRFAYGDVFTIDWPTASFDLITLNACVQYFPDLSRLLRMLMQLLRPNGEIHLLDSPFYKTSEIAEAKQRTMDYYQSQENAMMGVHYYHHSWEVLSSCNPQVRYNPEHWLARFRRRILRQGSPFPWIVIQN